MASKIKSFIKKHISDHKMNTTLLGSWELFEYYMDQNDRLLHIKEDQIKRDKMKWNLSFLEKGKFTNETNLFIPFFKKLEANRWIKSRNFVTLSEIDSLDPGITFQFAFDKGILKLLQKNKLGKIEIFAFFKRIS